MRCTFQIKFMESQNFFEAFTEFIVTIMLSSFANDLEFFINECKSLKKPYNNYFQKPTFDTWINIGEWLSKSLRRLKNDRDKWELLVELFGNPDDDFLETLMKKFKFFEKFKLFLKKI